MMAAFTAKRVRLIAAGLIILLASACGGPDESPEEAIRAWVREAGFVRVSHDETEMWHTEVYVRRGERGELGRKEEYL